MPLALPPLDRNSPEPLQGQLYRALREAILAGRLAAGTRLPSTRRLAQHLGLGRNTVLAAFDHLLAEGFVEARRGSGTMVASLPPVAAPAPQPSRDLLVPEQPAGHPPLRAAIAQWLGQTRGVRCTPDQVMIVSGSQQALDLTARVLLDPGDLALIEDPGYGGIRGVLRAQGAQVAAVPVDAAGFDSDLAESLAPQARLAYVTPSYQYPTGATMPLARRLALIAWARRRSGWIVEDDYDGEFHHAGPALPAVQGLDDERRTLHLGTFSKSMFPGLRLGWMVLPEDLVAPFLSARQLADMAPPSLTQAAMADFMAEGLFAKHMKRMRALYATRRAAFATACARHLAPFGRLSPGEAGLHSVLWLHGGDDAEAAAKARAAGLAVPPLSRYRVHPGPPGLVLGWGNIAEERMDTVVARLAYSLR